MHAVTNYLYVGLLAILPQVSDFAKIIGMPGIYPLAPNQLSDCNLSTNNLGLNALVKLTNGYEFFYERGAVQSFESGNCFYSLQDPRQVDKFFGEIKVGKQQAIERVKSIVEGLGFDREPLYMNLDPMVDLPTKVGRNTVARYRLSWIRPIDGSTSVEAEVDATDLKLHSLEFLNSTTWRTAKSHAASEGMRRRETFGEDQIKREGEEVLFAIKRFSEVLLGNSTLDISKGTLQEMTERVIDGHVSYRLIFQNGYTFYYTRDKQIGFTCPDVFFVNSGEIRPRDFFGSWKLSPAQTIAMARDRIKRLKPIYDVSGIQRDPEIEKPHLIGKQNIPRILVDFKNTGSNRYIIEIDAAHRELKSLQIYFPSRLAQNSQTNGNWRLLPEQKR